jgi:peptide/nickel transport system ATP-binding protein
VDNVSFSLESGESFGIAGESGSGKSTLTSAIMRNLTFPGKIESGTIILDDDDLTKLTDIEFNSKIRWKKISMIFQGAMNALDPVYKIRSQIREIFLTHKKTENFDRVFNIFRDFALDKSVLDKYPHELSGGMKQRVVIAMALLLEPDIIIADEPTTALDVLVQAQIINLLKKLKNEKQLSIIMISHDIALIAELVDKIGIMYSGEIVEINSTKEIISNPKHPYTRSLISSIPNLENKFITKINYFDRRLGRFDDNVDNDGCKYLLKCEHAMDICKKKPHDFRTGNDGQVKCWLFKEN